MDVADKIKLLDGGSCNTYLIDDKLKVLVDAGVDYDGKVDVILLTHGHEDHLTYLSNIMERNAKAIVYMGIKETELMMKQGVKMDARFKGAFEGKTVIETGKYKFSVIEVPSHTKGSVAYFDEDNKILFCGDTIFKDAIGRTDFPESIPEFMDNAVTMLMGLDFELALPGHGKPFKPDEFTGLGDVSVDK